MKALETTYGGYRFRSRLEARWAVFLDSLGVRFEYEPQGYELPSGRTYLPDFLVRCHGTRGVCVPDHTFDLFIEVKGRMTHEDASRIREFANLPEDGYDFNYGVESNPVLVVGDIPREGCSHDAWQTRSYERMDGTDVHPFNYETIDGDYFAAFPAAHDGHFYLWGDDSNYVNLCDVEAVERAYRNARRERFGR